MKKNNNNKSITNFNKKNFKTLLNSINRCYAKNIENNLPTVTDFPDEIFDKNNNLLIDSLISFANKNKNKYLISVAKRIKAVRMIIAKRDEGEEIETKDIWNLIRDSILEIPEKAIISSIGSQGFLSIPIYKYDEDMEKFDYIRLHIWSKDLSKHFNVQTSKIFSLHSHAFNCHSLIIYGKIRNDIYKVEQTSIKTNEALFKIEYNKTLNEINQHRSKAINTNIYVTTKQTSKEEHCTDGSYRIDAGNFHNSGSLSNDGLSATFFSFTTQNNKVKKSYVVGPSEKKESEINRKMHINPENLIKSIDLKLKSNG